MTEYKNVLFINYGGIGDEILFLPAIRSFKDDHKDAKITLALEPRSKSVKDLCGIIDEIKTVDIKAKGIKKYFNILDLIFYCRKQKFDCVISSGKSPFIAIILFLTGIKERIGYASKTDFLLTKKVSLNENQYAAKMYHDLVKPVCKSEFKNPKIEINYEFKLNKTLKKGEYIALHPGVSKMSTLKGIIKCPEFNFWLDLIKGLLLKNKQVVLLGGPDDEEFIEKINKEDEIINNKNLINYCNKTKNLLEMAFIMKNAKCVICVDSAPLHVAVGVEAKTFAIFGPTNELKLVPDTNNVLVIKNDIPCRPCLWHIRNKNCADSKCLNIDHNMILDKID